MKNTLTQFLLLIDYHGELKLMLNNDKSRDFIYGEIDEIERIEHLTCLIEHPSNLVEPLQPEHNNLKEEITSLKEEITSLKKENDTSLAGMSLEKEQGKQRLYAEKERSRAKLLEVESANCFNTFKLEAKITNLEEEIIRLQDLFLTLENVYVDIKNPNLKEVK